jgi:LysR family transcriptional regulator, hydrogen peroxide-inducible genes activator
MLRIGIIPTLAPYLLPIFIGRYKRQYPNIYIKVVEQTTNEIISLLNKDLIDVGILVTPLKEEKIIEKPLFYEEMMIYVNPESKLHKKKEITLKDIAIPEIWLLSDGHCFRDQVVNLCSFLGTVDSQLPFHFEAGSLETLMNIVDREGGITLIPELATLGMSEQKKDNVRSFSNLKPLREVSLVYSRHFAKHKLINLLWREIKDAFLRNFKMNTEELLLNGNNFSAIQKNNYLCALFFADVAELVDAPDLGSGATRRGGSSPFVRTIAGPSHRRLIQPVILPAVFNVRF